MQRLLASQTFALRAGLADRAFCWEGAGCPTCYNHLPRILLSHFWTADAV
jgi:hypothetical protein